MNKTVNSVEVFHQYAEDRLKEHIAELKTKYQNENLPLKSEKEKAFNEHFKHYKEELTAQIKDLSKNNIEAEMQLNDLCKVYEAKFKNNYSR